MSNERPRGRSRPKGKGPEDIPWLSREEVERRVDMRQRDPSLEPELQPESQPDSELGSGPEPGAEPEPVPGFNFDVLIGESDEPAFVAPTRVTPDRSTRHTPDREAAGERRRILWRDSATILVFVILALLGAQMFLPRGIGGPADSSLPSGINVGSLPPGVTLAPGMTLGLIVDPSLGIDASPTPIPAITIGPSQTPGPTLRPGQTPPPTPKPTAQPSHTPTTPPTAPPTALPTAPPTLPPTLPPTPLITPVPEAVAGFTWAQTSPPSDLTVDFTNTSSDDTSWLWDFGDLSPNSTAQNPTHQYASSGIYSVSLTVQGPGGSDSITLIISVSDT